MDVSQLTVEQLGGIVGLFGPCMDDYLYVYDFKRDYYFISADAMKRFRLPAEQFTDVLENHKHFVYPEDVDMLVDELKLLSTGKNAFGTICIIDGWGVTESQSGSTVGEECC